MEREEKSIYMGQVGIISLIAKYFAISEMLEICFCTNGVAPRGPYPVWNPWSRQHFTNGEYSLEQFRYQRNFFNSASVTSPKLRYQRTLPGTILLMAKFSLMASFFWTLTIFDHCLYFPAQKGLGKVWKA